MSTTQAAHVLDCSRQNVDDLVRRGRLKTGRPGPRRTIRILAESVAEYAETRHRDNDRAAPEYNDDDQTAGKDTVTRAAPASTGSDAADGARRDDWADLTERVSRLEARLDRRPDVPPIQPSTPAPAPPDQRAASATSAATLLAVSVSVQDELRQALSEADRASELLTQAVQASLRSKAALQRADRIRDQAVREFGYPSAPPGDM